MTDGGGGDCNDGDGVDGGGGDGDDGEGDNCVLRECQAV